jgi:hypothetical protein
MNLVLHQFKKEFRYQLSRWLGFLVLLGFDLALKLEWLFPMVPGGPWRGWMEMVTLIVGLVGCFLLWGCAEDRPGSDQSFISVRPLSLGQYTLARVLVWFALLVVPMVLQNTFYLVLSQRPWSDVLQIARQEGLAVVALTGFLLPLSVLLRQSKHWWMVVVVVLAYLITSKLVDAWIENYHSVTPSRSQNQQGRYAGLILFGLGAYGLAYQQVRRALTQRGKLLGLMALTIGALFLGRAWPHHAAAQDQALVDELAPSLKVNLDLSDWEYEESPGGKDKKQTIYAKSRLATGQAGIHARLRLVSGRVSQNGVSQPTKVSLSESSLKYFYQGYQAELFKLNAGLKSLFPEGTLFTSGVEGETFWLFSSADSRTQVAPLSGLDLEPSSALTVDADYAVDWFQRDIAVNLPLVAGAAVDSVSERIEVLRVEGNVDALGNHKLGSITADIAHYSRDRWDLPQETTLLLHSPERKLVWMDNIRQGTSQIRASGTGWSRRVTRHEWLYVLNHKDGERTAAQTKNLRLMLLRNRYLGTHTLQWQSPGITLNDYRGDRNIHRLNASNLYKGQEARVFHNRLATLTVPDANSSERAVRRYLYDLLFTTAKTGASYIPNVHPDIKNAFAPLGRDHLALMMSVPAEAWPGWSNRPPKTVLIESITDSQQDLVIDSALQNAQMVNVILSKGWKEQAKRLKAEILRRPKLPIHADYLLLAWADAESYEKLLPSAVSDRNGNIREALSKDPTMRPRLEVAVEAEFEAESPLISGSEVCNVETVAAAATDLGNAEALDICLNWLACSGDFRGIETPYPELLDAEGKDLWQRGLDEEKQWPRYRKLKAQDFTYLPDQRAWKLKGP